MLVDFAEQLQVCVALLIRLFMIFHLYELLRSDWIGLLLVFALHLFIISFFLDRRICTLLEDCICV